MSKAIFIVALAFAVTVFVSKGLNSFYYFDLFIEVFGRIILLFVNFLFTDAMSAPQFNYSGSNGTSFSSGGMQNQTSNMPGSGYG